MGFSKITLDHPRGFVMYAGIVSIPVFWTEISGRAIYTLMRHTVAKDSPCPDSSNIYYGHRAERDIGEHKELRNTDGFIEIGPYAEFAADPRWPLTCECGYEFQEDDYWTVNQEPLYVRPDTGEQWPMKSLPPGSMYDAFWNPEQWKNPDDGMALTVICPPMPESGDSRVNAWNIDGPASNQGSLHERAWTRTGDPRSTPSTVSATPSILIAPFHAYLTNGSFSATLYS